MSRDRGLCETCAYLRLIGSSKGSAFVLCERAAADERFRKYPSLPVLACEGWQPAVKPADTPRHGS